MKILTDKIIQPYMTEKSTKAQETKNEFAIIVDPSLTKVEIKKAVKDVFGVTAESVRTVIFRKKVRRTKKGEIAPRSFKKALIRLPAGKRLELK
ncbi:MAG: 50S ribosomal protein L23 [Bdellovibrionales bacterium]|nr:50S ribosomal protein L23 [Bdellovibrionales bacterium]